MDALLLCGYRPRQTIGLETDSDGFTFLDFQIHRLQAMGLSPTVVLAGAKADEYLYRSRFLESCELVYDTNGRDANLFTNLRSGLHAVSKACFALPIEILAPPDIIWKQLKIELLRKGFATDFHAFQVANAEGAPWHYGFPLLVSDFGRKAIRNMKTLKSLTDRRLRYHFSVPATLAHAAAAE